MKKEILEYFSKANSIASKKTSLHDFCEMAGLKDL